jgi:NAD(P)-dependent dehydrogenase (short-subunit alcohol dehydrogenase family)
LVIIRRVRGVDRVQHRFDGDAWGVILGGSSGFGLATAHKLAAHGMSLCLVHRDRRGAMARIEPELEKIRGAGVQLRTWNADALDPGVRAEILAGLREALGATGRVRVLLHSIAFGNLKPLLAAPGDRAARALDAEDFARTVHAMGTSLVDWVQDLHQAGLFAPDARVFGLTSEGNEVAWTGYAAVSAAKAALEAVARSIAMEFAPHGIRCNVLQPGVTETPALAAIPGSDRIKASALARNPFGRLTAPRDVADVVYLLSLDEAAWINGALLRVDGGERIAGSTA